MEHLGVGEPGVGKGRQALTLAELIGDQRLPMPVGLLGIMPRASAVPSLGESI